MTGVSGFAEALRTALGRDFTDQLIDTLGCIGVDPAVDLDQQGDSFSRTALVAVVVAVAMPIIEAEAILAATGWAGLMLAVESIDRHAESR